MIQSATTVGCQWATKWIRFEMKCRSSRNKASAATFLFPSRYRRIDPKLQRETVGDASNEKLAFISFLVKNSPRLLIQIECRPSRRPYHSAPSWKACDG